MALLECRQIGKRFGGETALAEVDFDLEAGEVHGLVGSNGAGKSTLMKILSGALPDHEGTIALNGQQVTLASPQRALELGIAMVYQELSGIGALSVAENLFLGRQPGRWGLVDWNGMRRQAARHLAELEIDIDVSQRLDRYSLATRQMVEIARGLHSGARVLILDEPTSALSPPETRRLFQLIERLKTRGVAVVFISHFLEDVLEICDRVTLLKDGRRLETAPVGQLTKHYVIHRMLGHDLQGEEIGYETGVTLPPRVTTPPRLVARGLTRRGAFQDVQVAVAPGECLGIYGFAGSGHQELAHALAGALEVDSGSLLLDGLPMRTGDMAAAVKRGVALVAADRAKTVFHRFEIYKNITLTHLRAIAGEWVTARREEQFARPLVDQVGCRPPLPRLLAGGLSGGNQQKVVMARWLAGPIRVLVLDEPTRGMDVGAKEEIMRLVADLKRDGTAVILASSEPELVQAQADRILVMRRGQAAHEFVDMAVDKAALMRHA